MPGFDRTGPNGLGPMTGGGFGNCAVPGQTANYIPRGAGRGFAPWGGGRGFCYGGRGRGRGFGRLGVGNFAYAAPAVNVSYEAEKQNLINMANQMKQQIDLINQRIEELNKASDTTSTEE